MDKRQYLKEILEYIPAGAQTLSKTPSQHVIGVTPLTVSRAKGVYLWDREGNKYLDTVLALGPTIFGYANDRIDGVVKEQIGKGTTYSLPSEHELGLAKLLRETVPCAEMSRFLMSGNEATAGAIRLARHITKRDHVAKCGYHGFQDWSVATMAGRNTGIPEAVKGLTHDFKYNDMESLEKIFKDYPNQIAAVIMEPVSTEKPANGFLEEVQERTRKHGALFIFDELITGFRWALGGAQEYFGVIPDLACFGKALGAGYPISAICGKAKYMKRMEEVFVSPNFGGFTPGLVAAMESIRMMREYGDVHQHIHTLGGYLIDKGNEIAAEYHLPIQLVGFGPHPVMTIGIEDDYWNRVVRTYIFQEMNKGGILFSTSMMIGYPHRREEIDLILREFTRICSNLADIKNYREIESLLEGDVIVPLRVREIQ